MKQNEKRNCKIVQDLLPNYIEKLTDEVTNEFIEEHLATCGECRRVLQDMNGDIQLEEIDQEREIKYLKGVKRKVKRTIALVSLIVIIIASCITLYVYNKSKIQVNNYTFLKAEFVREEKDTKDGKLYSTVLAVIDERGICKSVRIVEKGYTEEYMMEIISDNKKFSKAKGYMNVIIQGEELHYNINTWNGYNKEELKGEWVKYYKDIKIEEI